MPGPVPPEAGLSSLLILPAGAPGLGGSALLDPPSSLAPVGVVGLSPSSLLNSLINDPAPPRLKFSGNRSGAVAGGINGEPPAPLSSSSLSNLLEAVDGFGLGVGLNRELVVVGALVVLPALVPLL